MKGTFHLGIGIREDEMRNLEKVRASGWTIVKVFRRGLVEALKEVQEKEGFKTVENVYKEN